MHGDWTNNDDLESNLFQWKAILFIEKNYDGALDLYKWYQDCTAFIDIQVQLQRSKYSVDYITSSSSIYKIHKESYQCLF